MKKFLIAVLSVVFLAVSCGGGSSESESESKKIIDEKSQTVSASEGGEVALADGFAKIKIPAGALEKDTEISLKLYETNGFNNKKALASNVVEFAPAGIKFKKPVIITINAKRSINGKTVAAAVMKSDGTWSYSKNGAYVTYTENGDGDIEMLTAAGDPIMASNGNLTTAAGDPIMNAAAGDPIMLASAGDPIMTNAAGDPIMNAAAGDPIMMTTAHFSVYTFIVVDEAKEVEKEDNNGGDSDKITCRTVQEWDTLYDDTEDSDYSDKEDVSIYCQSTGDMVVYCAKGDFFSEIYSIKVGDKEFICESDNMAGCFIEKQKYCGELEGEYDDGYYCEEQGTCEKTGEMSKLCVSTKDDEAFYQAGDQKFECLNDDVEACQLDFYEYCGEII